MTGNYKQCYGLPVNISTLQQAKSQTLLQKITSGTRGGLLSLFLHSEQLCKYLKTLFNHQDKNVLSPVKKCETMHKHHLSHSESKCLHLEI